MSDVIHLTDNCNGHLFKEENTLQDVMRIADIGCLQNAPNLLVFPHSFKEHNDGIENLSILTIKDTKYDDGKCIALKACTGNLMGFVGVNDTSLSIHSRFTHKRQNGEVDENGQDYFLYYMLAKALSINVFSLEHSSNQDDRILDFLLFLFPSMLKNALSQGLYKEYQTRYYDDSRVRGTIDVNRFIQKDVPFKGRVSHHTREHCYDNSVTQLIRHTIEYIKRHPFGAAILQNDQETVECVSQIMQATSSYNQRNREKVLNANIKPKIHPYYLKYRDLQQLCVNILRHESLKYGQGEDKVNGVLFDGAWLWEEYLDTVLRQEGFRHPRNKESKGGIRMFAKPDVEDLFDNNSRRMYPDFYRKDDYILDAKYKHLNGTVGREDLYQVVSYMYCMKAPFGGYVYPAEVENTVAKYKLAGIGETYKDISGGILSVIPFKVPQEAKDWGEFLETIKESEESLRETVNAHY